MERQATQYTSIRKKLTAAVAMLMVAFIMVVSSTYAWFTLSTAPEVTGITTAVGSNGNLEIALLPTDGDVTKIGTASTTLDQAAKNLTWGNLVDLSDIYGLDQIVLYPAALNAGQLDENGNVISFGTAILKTPAYGADGRVSEMKENTVTGTYDSGNQSFPVSDAAYGVRAVGVNSGMTDRQLAYRNLRSAAATAMAQAKTLAAQSLNANGATLANIAIQKATNDAATYDQTHVAALQAIVDDLLGTDSKTGALEYIENAYLNYIAAAMASKEANLTDGNWAIVSAALREKTLQNFVDGFTVTDENNTTVATIAPLAEPMLTPVKELLATIAKVESADTDLETLASQSAIPWANDTTNSLVGISTPLYKLADTNNMLVNGIKVSDVKDQMSALVNSVAKGGLTVTMASGGGVYANIADHCGDYSASVVIQEVKYGNFELKELDARMETDSNQDPNFYLVKAAALFGTTYNAPVTEEGNSMPISDMYGYVIDLALRTNAASSNLLLQQQGIDRIYSTNTEDSETMGGGSSMTFQAVSADFTNDQVKELMSAIRIVFFTPGTNSNTVLATAKLDIKNATLGADGLTALMYLYENETVYKMDANKNYLKADDSILYYYDSATNAYYTERSESTTGTGEEAVTTYTYDAAKKITEEAMETGGLRVTEVEEKVLTGTDAIITAMTQNQAQKVSVLVYLDGTAVDNGDVSATGSTSMTGKMNLQFASSATLDPMDYTDLMNQGTNTGTGEGTGN